MGVNWWLVGLLALPGLLAAMILRISWQNWRVRHWGATAGRIVESRNASRDVRSKDSRLVGRSNGGSATVVTNERIDRKNFADVAYVYTVAGQTFSGRQVGPGADHGNLDVVTLLRRYPKGKIVTVHYNPAAPGESILQRDDPRRFRAAWLAVAILIATIVGGFYAFDHVVAFVRAHVRDPARMPLVVFALAAALLMALMAWATARRAWTMRRWPTADGIVVESRVERTMTRRTRRSRTTSTPFYIPRVVYRFRVEGVEIDGDRLGRSVSSSTSGVVERLVAAFPVGTRVVVHYDPAEPTTAVVDPGAGMVPLALAAAAAILVLIAGGLAVL